MGLAWIISGGFGASAGCARRRPADNLAAIARLGKTDLDVSPLCLGGNVFGWTIDEPRSFEVLDAYVAGGGNFIDTADAYGRRGPGGTGGSERIIGRCPRRTERMVPGTRRFQFRSPPP